MISGLVPYLKYRSKGYYVDDHIQDQPEWEKNMSKIAKTCLKNAYERNLETQREDALFRDPLAKHLCGVSGELFSQRFSEAAKFLGFLGWPEFCIQFTAVGTLFVDQWLRKAIPKVQCAAGHRLQIVNLGSGMDARAYRLDFLTSDMVMFEVDLPSVNAAKLCLLQDVDGLTAQCQVKPVDCDLLKDPLETCLLQHGFNPQERTLWLSEGLFSYLRPKEHQVQVIKDIVRLSGRGSEACFHFKASGDYPCDGKNDVPKASIVEVFNSWASIKFTAFGDAELDFGRYQAEKPNARFSYAVCIRNNNVNRSTRSPV